MSYRLLHLSDPHFGANDERQAEAIVEFCRSADLDFVLISGDFSMRARRHEMKAAREWLRRLPNPKLCIPGNHDVPLLNHPIDRFFFPFRRYRKYIHPDLEPSAELKIGRLLSFNSSTPFGLHVDWSRGFLSPIQGSRMIDGFADDPEGLRLVTFHHPIWRPGDSKRSLIGPLPLVMRALSLARADIVFAGHFHQSNVLLMDYSQGEGNFLLSQVSTACSTRLKGEPAGFHLLEVVGEFLGDAVEAGNAGGAEAGDGSRGVTVAFDRYIWKSDGFAAVERQEFKRSAGRWRQG